MTTDMSCYVLYSKALKEFQVGVTIHNDLENSVQQHIEELKNLNVIDRFADDWKVYLEIETESYEHSLRIEKYLNQVNSSKFIQHLKKHPELLETFRQENLSLQLN